MIFDVVNVAVFVVTGAAAAILVALTVRAIAQDWRRARLLAALDDPAAELRPLTSAVSSVSVVGPPCRSLEELDDLGHALARELQDGAL